MDHELRQQQQQHHHHQQQQQHNSEFIRAYNSKPTKRQQLQQLYCPKITAQYHPTDTFPALYAARPLAQ
jgi:hypothetical protein